ncbi:hypothetical protein Ddc_11953 [Ditylenchus destructor]|nr:hypothetical protein Ddc_11953 [Ditylenchus destructor]
MPLPNHVLVDILRYSNRFDLDSTQMSSRLMRDLIDNNFTNSCLRDLTSVTFYSDKVDISSSSRDLEIYVDEEEGLWPVVFALKHSFVDEFEVVHFRDQENKKVSLSDVCDLLDKLKSLAVIRKLAIESDVDTSGVGPAELEKLLIDSVPLSEFWCGGESTLPHPQHITDSLLRKCAAKGIVSLDFDRKWPEKGAYELTEDGILDFCFGTEAAQISKPRKLVVGHCQVTRNLFLRLVEASEQSKITTPLQLKIYDVKVESQQVGKHKGIEKTIDYAPATVFCFPTHSTYTEIQFVEQCPDCTYVLHLNRGMPRKESETTNSSE